MWHSKQLYLLFCSKSNIVVPSRTGETSLVNPEAFPFRTYPRAGGAHQVNVPEEQRAMVRKWVREYLEDRNLTRSRKDFTHLDAQIHAKTQNGKGDSRSTMPLLLCQCKQRLQQPLMIFGHPELHYSGQYSATVKFSAHTKFACAHYSITLNAYKICLSIFALRDSKTYEPQLCCFFYRLPPHLRRYFSGIQGFHAARSVWRQPAKSRMHHPEHRLS